MIWALYEIECKTSRKPSKKMMTNQMNMETKEDIKKFLIETNENLDKEKLNLMTCYRYSRG